MSLAEAANADVVSCVRHDAHRALLGWLDDGLRAGRRGRLRAEYPVSLASGNTGCHRVVTSGEELLAHAMSHVVRARAPEPVTVGMIGLVYTDPAARGRGLASRCIEACVADLAGRDAKVALLWSDKHAFYQRLGFAPIGSEVHYRIDAAVCRRAFEALSCGPALRVDAVRARDWNALERLYLGRPVRVDRQAGALRKLAGAPETRLVVARRGKRPVAYAALGRGDDFRGVIHEWAGEPAGVVRCLEALCLDGELVWLRGPTETVLDPALRNAGALPAENRFALGRVLDPAFEIPPLLYLWGFDSI